MNFWENYISGKKLYLYTITVITLTSIIICMSKLVAQDYNNSCFFCHMNVIVEMKNKAATHWDAGVDCEACHGTSGEHVDVEDNSIKPDSIWMNNNVHELCNNCHEDVFLSYGKSAHAKLILKGTTKENDSQAPSCIFCHGAHGMNTKSFIQNLCLKCHSKLSEKCEIESIKKESSESSTNCKRCHNYHSLQQVINLQENHEKK